jgi:hypothetical protein
MVFGSALSATLSVSKSSAGSQAGTMPDSALQLFNVLEGPTDRGHIGTTSFPTRAKCAVPARLGLLFRPDRTRPPGSCRTRPRRPGRTTTTVAITALAVTVIDSTSKRCREYLGFRRCRPHVAIRTAPRLCPRFPATHKRKPDSRVDKNAVTLSNDWNGTF